jgi:hypothetical protein
VEAGRGLSRSPDAVSSTASTTHGGRWACRYALLALNGLSARAGATCGEGSPVGDGSSSGEEEEEGLGCRPSTYKLGSLCPCGPESLTLHAHAVMPGVGVTWSIRNCYLRSLLLRMSESLWSVLHCRALRALGASCRAGPCALTAGASRAGWLTALHCGPRGVLPCKLYGWDRWPRCHQPGTGRMCTDVYVALALSLDRTLHRWPVPFPGLSCQPAVLLLVLSQAFPRPRLHRFSQHRYGRRKRP